MESEQLITKARRIKEKYEKEAEAEKEHFEKSKGLATSAFSRNEVKNYVLEELTGGMGVELDERGYRFRNPNDPRIKEAREIVEEVFRE